MYIKLFMPYKVNWISQEQPQKKPRPQPGRCDVLQGFEAFREVRLAVEARLVGDLGDALIRPQQQVYAFVDPVGHEITKERLPDGFLKEAAAFASAEADEGGNIFEADAVRIVDVYEAKYFFQALAVFVYPRRT